MNDIVWFKYNKEIWQGKVRQIDFNDDDDDDGTSAKEDTCYRDGDGAGASAGAVNGGGDRNTGARGGSAESMRLLSPSALSETSGAMAKAKASSLTKLRKNLKLVKIKNKIA